MPSRGWQSLPQLDTASHSDHSRRTSTTRSSSPADTLYNSDSTYSPPVSHALLEDGLIARTYELEDDGFGGFVRALNDVVTIKTHHKASPPSSSSTQDEKAGLKRSSSRSSRRWNCSVGSRLFARFLRLIFALLFVALLASIIYYLCILLPFLFSDPEDFFGDTIVPGGPDRHVDHSPVYHNVLPVPCHSHNDEWRHRPLKSALRAGCISVEADVWYVDDTLYVGHSKSSLTRDATLADLYLDPLLNVLARNNDAPQAVFKGVFTTIPAQSLVLMIDFKTNVDGFFDAVHESLAPLRDQGYLTHWNGTHRIERPITVVASGEAPFDMIVVDQAYRDIFYDAPLNEMVAKNDPYPLQPAPDGMSSPVDVLDYKYNPSNSHYASTNMREALGIVGQHWLGKKQMAIIRSQVALAKERGLVSRYWGGPNWPRAVEERLWKKLLRAQVGMLNVDDLRAVKRFASKFF